MYIFSETLNFLNFFQIILNTKFIQNKYLQEIAETCHDENKLLSRIEDSFRQCRKAWIRSLVVVLIFTAFYMIYSFLNAGHPFHIFLNPAYWASSLGFYAGISRAGKGIESLGGETLPERADRSAMIFFLGLSFFFLLIAIS